ncbi:hypothetical protein [Roseivivax isoporae]|uniref:Uncharacterized protein n=1 Tax=Roseivivax isoporae LMG 25204 TaxID=1449351 RepID=X7F1T3_9RHOB|nr:hypothetical protein [Roseivivax isoporae]ETX26877.1 hypothetical protein RISW2_18755 [Roseivivax isoporae LMG 25204]
MADIRFWAAAAALLAGGAQAAPLGPLPSHDAAALLSPPLVRVLDDRVRHTTDLPTAELRLLRRRMLNDQWISFQDMRRLADAGDGLAAFEYAERLLHMDDPDLVGPAAFYYATAAYAGRDYAVWKLVDLLGRRDLEFSDRRLDHLENALRSLAVRGSERAEAALLDFYESGHPFGRRPDRVATLLTEMAEAGDTDAAMRLAKEALSDRDYDIGQDRLVALLEIAMTSEELGTRAAAAALRDQVRAGTIGPDQTAEATQ